MYDDFVMFLFQTGSIRSVENVQNDIEDPEFLFQTGSIRRGGETSRMIPVNAEFLFQTGSIRRRGS